MRPMIDDREVWVRYPSQGYSYEQPVYDNPNRFSGGLFAVFIVILLIFLGIWSTDYSFRSYFRPVSVSLDAPARPVTPVTVSVDAPALRLSSDLRYVVADSLNMREGPDNYSYVTYVLPRGTRVNLLGETHQEIDGDVWVRVSVNTLDGIREGWVSRQYLS